MKGGKLEMSAAMPETGFLRINQIVGDPKANPPIAALLPISKSSWWNGVRSGKYPPSIKLGEKTTVWRVEDIRQLIAKLSAKPSGTTT